MATGQVEYGETNAYGRATLPNQGLSISHQFTLTQLLPGTQYHYRVNSTDAAGNSAVSLNQTFTTPQSSPTDTTPPENIGAFTNRPGDRQILLEWLNPDDPDFAGVRIVFRDDRMPDNIDDGSHLGDFTGEPNEKGTFLHEGLDNEKTYYYIAAAYDARGNLQEGITLSAKPGDGELEADAAAAGGGGGCGIVFPLDGNPPGPGDAAGMMTIIGILLLITLKKAFKTANMPTVSEWRHIKTSI